MIAKLHNNSYGFGRFAKINKNSLFTAIFTNALNSGKIATMQMEKRILGFSLIEIVIVVAIIGVSVSIAIPQYTRYVSRTQVTDAINTVASARTAVSSLFQTQGLSTTTSLDDIGLNRIHSLYLSLKKRKSSHESFALDVSFTPNAVSNLAGKTLIFLFLPASPTPLQCASSTISDYLPRSCQTSTAAIAPFTRYNQQEMASAQKDLKKLRNQANSAEKRAALLDKRADKREKQKTKAEERYAAALVRADEAREKLDTLRGDQASATAITRAEKRLNNLTRQADKANKHLQIATQRSTNADQQAVTATASVQTTQEKLDVAQQQVDLMLNSLDSAK